ncbi:response regulator transcription factor [Robertkochia solimangrovi]|uniref:response regulator transcription factor n=1 Tax=Robertkochia solimangrovi TaxID=2213046 RepID=UPI00117D5A55|nr:response regulator transcription factor [Robertkochia solimangrovi]TRZ43620.1 DNA-binding response regulator [Robertkochia solimangrovi]
MNILIVEDEPGIVDFLKQGLEEESYNVSVAYEGRSGLTMAMEGHLDLIILDWMVPGVSGIEICRQVRKNDLSTPIIFLTAKDTVDETVFGLQAGANDYIKKPFHFAELLERIKVQLRSRTESETSYHVGPIVLNPSTHQVFKSDKEIKLTLKEFSLLEYLMKNKDRVCTRARILDHVWDINYGYDTGVIDVYINALRKKLDLTNEDYIQTIRGVGYLIKNQ